MDRFAAEYTKTTGKEAHRVNPVLAVFRRVERASGLGLARDDHAVADRREQAVAIRAERFRIAIDRLSHGRLRP